MQRFCVSIFRLPVQTTRTLRICDSMLARRTRTLPSKSSIENGSIPTNEDSGANFTTTFFNYGFTLRDIVIADKSKIVSTFLYILPGTCITIRIYEFFSHSNTCEKILSTLHFYCLHGTLDAKKTCAIVGILSCCVLLINICETVPASLTPGSTLINNQTSSHKYSPSYRETCFTINVR